MSKKITFLSVLFVILFMSSSLVVGAGVIGIQQFAQNMTQDESSVAGYPATDLDYRNSPVSILVYTEFADTITAAPNSEFRNTLDSIKATYGEKFRYDNLTDYANLAVELPNYDVFLIPEQELLYAQNITDIVAAWNGLLDEFVNNGGILIVMDCYTYSGLENGPTFQLLNATGIVEITNPLAGSAWTNNLVNTSDALARGVSSSWSAPDGSVYFETTDCEVVVDDGTHAVVAHKIMGKGHIVLLGFDLFDRETNSDILLANAIRLHRHVVFDDSHDQPFEINDEFSTIAEYFASSGFAVSEMKEFSADYIAACDIFVITLCSTAYDASDIAVLVDFVEHGGGLFVCADYGSWGEKTDELVQQFGFLRYNSSQAMADSDDGLAGNDNNIPFEGENILNHSITLAVNRVELYSTSSYITIPQNGFTLIKTDGDGTATLNNTAVAACVTYGAGRVVILGDTNALTNSDADSDAIINCLDSDNEVFLLNTIRWLSAAGIEEKTILFDASHTYNFLVTASYRGFVNLLTENGYTVFWMDNFYEELIDECDVFVVEDGSTEYTSVEVDYIHNFVNDGGKLLLLGGQGIYGNETDPIGQRFGMDLNNTGYLIDTDDSTGLSYYISYDTSNFGNHPIMQGLTDIEAQFGTAFETIGGATALITTDNDGTCQWNAGGLANALPIMAAKQHNKGRVVYSADYWIPRDNQDGDGDGTSNLYDADNPLLLLNIFHWLVEDRAPTVEVIYPNGGEVLNGTHFIDWDAADLDDDPMVYAVYLSNNNGSSWSVLDTGLTVSEYEFNTTLYEDANSYMVRIVVTANGVSTEDTSDTPFEIDNIPYPIEAPLADLTLIVVIMAGVVVGVIIIFIILKKKK